MGRYFPALLIAGGFLGAYMIFGGETPAGRPAEKPESLVLGDTPETAKARAAGRALPVKAAALAPAPAQAEQPAVAPAGELTKTPVRQLAPSAADLRAEVAKNPHSTPQALMMFSLNLHEKTEAAMASETASEALFYELQECVVGAGKHANPSVQTLCMLNARRLQARHDSLSRRFENLQRQADPEILKLMSGLPN